MKPLLRDSEGRIDGELVLAPKKPPSEELLSTLQRLGISGEEKGNFLKDWGKAKQEGEKFLEILIKDFGIGEGVAFRKFYLVGRISSSPL